MHGDSPRLHSQPVRVAAAFAYLLSVAGILAAARGDLWVDEIMSIWIARSVPSAVDVFRFHFDNNHALNTLFLYYAQGQHPPSLYRLPAVIAGIGSVLLVGTIARREWGEAESLCVVLLAGLSYPLLLYFSEARGYALAIFFALAAYEILRQNMAQPSRTRLVLFWVSNLLGILSHLTFAIVFLANFAMHFVQQLSGVASRRPGSAGFLVHHVPAMLAIAAWTLYFVHDMEVGSGPIYGKWDVAGEAAALLLGLPQNEAARIVAVILVLAVIVAGSVSLLRERNPAWTFFGMALLVSPLTVFLAVNPSAFYFRYFIVCFPFFYLLLSHVLCNVARLEGHIWRPVAAAAVCLIVAAQGFRIYPLLELGRGDYTAALLQILKQSQQPVVRLGSDHDFRNRTLIAFYVPFLPGGHRLRYIEQSRWREEPPDWMVTHSQELSHRPPLQITLAPGLDYEFVTEYRFSGISGWNWYLYRRQRSLPASQNTTPITAVAVIASP